MTDYIDRDTLLGLARNKLNGMVNANDIANFPSADVQEVKHAHWILKSDESAVCSNCNRLDHVDSLAKYCRYCGAKIDKLRN